MRTGLSCRVLATGTTTPKYSAPWKTGFRFRTLLEVSSVVPFLFLIQFCIPYLKYYAIMVDPTQEVVVNIDILHCTIRPSISK